jgi:hypothetical protein
VTYGLERFVAGGIERARRLCKSHQPRDAWEFARYMLAGRRYTGNPSKPFEQIRLDLRSQSQPLDPDRVQRSQDIDSVIAATSTIIMKPGHALSVYCLVNFQETLKKNNHLKIGITSVTGARVTVPMFHVPNFCIAKIGLRGKVLVLMPKLWAAGQHDRRVNIEHIRVWWNEIMRRAIGDLDEGRLSSIPTSYAAAEHQQRETGNGHLHSSTYDIPGELVERLCAGIHRYAANITVFHEIVFVVEFRGTKGVARTVIPRDADDDYVRNMRLAAMSECMEPLSDRMLDAGNRIWMDVASEYTLPGHVVLMDEDEHALMLTTVFPRMSMAKAHRVVNSAQFERDYFAQMYQVSGARYDITSVDPVFENAEYYQNYSTTKNHAYSLDFGNDYSNISTRETLPQGITRLCAKLGRRANGVREAFVNPADDVDNNSVRLDGGVRVEVRIAWSEADEVMIRAPDSARLLRMLYAVRREDVWYELSLSPLCHI